jgi:hypothetical protein
MMLSRMQLSFRHLKTVSHLSVAMSPSAACKHHKAAAILLRQLDNGTVRLFDQEWVSCDEPTICTRQLINRVFNLRSLASEGYKGYLHAW